MAVLVVDLGGTPLTLNCQRGGHAAPRRVGSARTGDSGTEESSVRAELMVVPIVTAPIPNATYATLKSTFALGAQKTCQGDIFNNNYDQIVCSGKITGELRETADSWIVSLTLYEVGNAATGVTSPDTTTFFFTDDTDPTDPTAKTVTTTWAFQTGDCFYALEFESPTPCVGPSACPILYSSAAERVWLSPPLAAASITGTPVAVLNSKGTEGLGAFAIQSSLVRLYLCRGGTDVSDAVEGPVDSAYRPGAFFGGNIPFPFSAPVSWTVLDGDVLRIEIWSRLALLPGESDPSPVGYDLWRQTLCYGGPGGTGVIVGGVIEPL